MSPILTKEMQLGKEKMTPEVAEAVFHDAPDLVIEKWEDASAGAKSAKADAPRAFDLFRKFSPGMTVSFPDGTAWKIVRNTSMGVTVQSGGRRYAISWDVVAKRISLHSGGTR